MQRRQRLGVQFDKANDQLIENLMGQQNQPANKVPTQAQQQPRSQLIQPAIKKVRETKFYKPGQFSEFAVKREKQLNSLQLYIQDVIRQAIMSHLQKIRQLLNFQKAMMQQSKRIEQNLVRSFGVSNQIVYKFILNPIQTYLQYFQCDQIESYIGNFCQKVIQVYDLSIIQGKITKINRLVLDEQLKRQKESYIPLKFNEKVFVKAHQFKPPVYMFLHNGKFKNRKQLLELSSFERQQIMQMVTQFLINKNIQFDQGDIVFRINKQIQSELKK